MNESHEGGWGFPSLSNHAVETINEIEDILVKRCFVVSEMKDDVHKLTNYHWLQCCDRLPSF